MSSMPEIIKRIMSYHAQLKRPQIAYSASCSTEEEFTELQLQEHRDYCLAAIVEITEVLNEAPWKPWKRDDQGVRISALTEELADVFFFIVGLLEIWNVSGDDYQYAVERKLAKCQNRLMAGYNK